MILSEKLLMAVHASCLPIIINLQIKTKIDECWRGMVWLGLYPVQPTSTILDKLMYNPLDIQPQLMYTPRQTSL